MSGHHQKKDAPNTRKSRGQLVRDWWKETNKTLAVLILILLILMIGLLVVVLQAKLPATGSLDPGFILRFLEISEDSLLPSFTAPLTALGWLIGIYYLDKRARLFQKQIEEQQKQIAQQQEQHQQSFCADQYHQAIAHMAEQNEQAGIVGFTQIKGLLDQLQKAAEQDPERYTQYRHLSFYFLCSFLRLYTQSKEYLENYHPPQEKDGPVRYGKPSILVQDILNFLIPKKENKESHHFSDSDTFKLELTGANLQGANLTGANLQRVTLSNAQMQGAYLRGAQMQGAYLANAQMQGAYLANAQMQKATLTAAQIQGAMLRGAQMQEANLTAAQMQGAYLRDVQMQGACLSDAQMQGADFRKVQMQGADLKAAIIQHLVFHPDEQKKENVRKSLKESTSNLEGIVFYGEITEKWLEKNKDYFSSKQYEKLKTQAGKEPLTGKKGDYSLQDEELRDKLTAMEYESREYGPEITDKLLKLLDFQAIDMIIRRFHTDADRIAPFKKCKEHGWLEDFASYEALLKRYPTATHAWVEYAEQHSD